MRWPSGAREFYKSNRAFRSAVKNMIAYKTWDDELADRASLAARVSELAEDGKIAVVNHGMDCDCSAWSGRMELIPATVMSVVKWEREFYKWAEGPQGYYLERPSVASGIHSSSRDLAMEAYEDGHSHVVYY